MDVLKKSKTCHDVWKVCGAVGLNVLLRLGSLSLTIATTKLVPPSFRGCSFQAEMVADTLGFLSRESIRALYPTYRNISSSKQRAIRLFSVALLCLPLLALVVLSSEILALFITAVPRLSMLSFLSDKSPLPLGMFIAGVLLEFISEPLMAMVLVTHSFHLRVASEAIALIVSKAALLILLLAPYYRYHPALPVAISRLVYGGSMLFFLYITAWLRVPPPSVSTKAPTEELSLGDLKAELAGIKCFRGVCLFADIFPRSLRVASIEASFVLSPWWRFFCETLTRIVLTEGERCVLLAYVALDGQGIFDAVNGLGTMVARMVFRVWENAAFNIWSAAVAPASAVVDRVRVTAGEGLGAAQKEHQRKMLTCFGLLYTLVRACCYLAMFCVPCASPLARFLLTLLFSRQWAVDDAVTVLKVFCVYIPLMGVNGVLEAFLRATAPRMEFTMFQRLMVLSSAFSIVLTIVFVNTLKGGVVGLVLAATINMCFRISMCLLVLHRYALSAKRIAKAAGSIALVVVPTTFVISQLVWMSYGEIKLNNSGRFVALSRATTCVFIVAISAFPVICFAERDLLQLYVLKGRVKKLKK